LLKEEFPSLRFVNLPGYNLKYGGESVITTLKIFFQIPKILIQINRERRWLNIFLRKENIGAIISDNRYGLHSKKIISIFITHQLCIKTPVGKPIERRLQQLNYSFSDNFSVCWIPDFEKNNSFAGELSHPKIFPKTPIHYIGLLSRFEKKEMPFIYRLLIVLSGPEPQRTILENILLKELKSFNEKTILIRGLPGEKNLITTDSNIEIHNHLPASELNGKICQAELVICRSGYSTVMDLARLGKKYIVIPTPGQTEQEYLADYLFQKKIALKINQKDFSLGEAIEASQQFPFEKYEKENNQLLAEAICALTKKIYSSKK
jgi:UDP-N-acetylglucosamine transferase subunit ALG13